MGDVSQPTDPIAEAASRKPSPHYVAGQVSARNGEPWPQRPGWHSSIRDWLFWNGYKAAENAADAE